MNILFLAILFFFIIIIFLNISSKQTSTELPYEKTPLLNEGEKNFYRTLKTTTKNDFLIFPKTRLIDIIKIKKTGKSYHTYKNKIIQKHIDFLLCDPESLEVKLAIELDGLKHDEIRQKNNDIFKNEVLKKIGIPLLRIQAKKSYTPNELQKLIKMTIQNPPPL